VPGLAGSQRHCLGGACAGLKEIHFHCANMDTPERRMGCSTKGLDSFILFVCPVQQILSRSAIIHAQAHIST